MERGRAWRSSGDGPRLSCLPPPAHPWAALAEVEQGPPAANLGDGAAPDLHRGVVDDDELAEVELVSEPFAFGLVQDPLIVVISGDPKDESRRLAGRMHSETQPHPRLPRLARWTPSCSWITASHPVTLRGPVPKPRRGGNLDRGARNHSLFI